MDMIKKQAGSFSEIVGPSDGIDQYSWASSA